MTNGKNALSAMPKNQRIAKRPLKLYTATTKIVHRPKVSIMHGSTILGPNFLPSRPRNGAVRTYGTKKILRIMLYWLPLRWRVSIMKRHVRFEIYNCRYQKEGITFKASCLGIS